MGEEAVAQRLEAGETRGEIVDLLTSDWQYNVLDLAAVAADDVAMFWTDAEQTAPAEPDRPRPEPSAAFDEWVASVRRGRALYLSPDTQCVACHGVDGSGRGPRTASAETDEATGEPYPEIGLHDVWGRRDPPPQPQRPASTAAATAPSTCTAASTAASPASKMPGFGQSLSDEQIWDLVNFVLALPRDPSLLKDAEVAATH